MVAEYKVRIVVEHKPDEDPTDLTPEELNRAFSMQRVKHPHEREFFIKDKRVVDP